jgi:hypothetical protein
MSVTKAQLVGGVGISTVQNLVVGSATTFTEDLVVQGDARVTGILTVGTSSITLDGTNNSMTLGTGNIIDGSIANQIKVGSGLTINSSGVVVGVLTASSFFGNGAGLSGVDPFPAGTVMLFQQTASPTGWTKITTHNDKTLRVVSGSASSGGSTAFTSVFTSRSVNGTVGNTTLTTSQMPSHNHTIDTFTAFSGSSNLVKATGSVTLSSTPATSSTGSGGSHNHSFTGTALDFDVQYVDVIFASKN